MMNKNLLRSVGLAAFVCAMGLGGGCGQKGPLSLPKDAPKPVAAPTTAASSPINR